MVRRRPGQELFEPAVALDRNLRIGADRKETIDVR
jgi:hypothetical protein